jgi:hypothetical protein
MVVDQGCARPIREQRGSHLHVTPHLKLLCRTSKVLSEMYLRRHTATFVERHTCLSDSVAWLAFAIWECLQLLGCAQGMVHRGFPTQAYG